MARIFYNIEMAKALRELTPPVKGFVLDMKAMPDFLALTVYEENIMEYSETQRADIMEYLLTAKKLIESYGVRCEIMGVKYLPGKKHF